MATKNKIIITNQLGDTISLQIAAQRIVSLVPSITETLCQMGLENRVVGVTKFCVHPFGFKNKNNIIGGTKNINFAKIVALMPDLVIASKEENIKAQIEELKLICPVYISNIKNGVSSMEAFKHLATLTQVDYKNLNWYAAFEAFNNLPNNTPTKNCLYLIWQNPYMTIGGDTFINYMLTKAGFINLFQHQNRYPIVSETFFINNNIDYVFLSSEPFPFKQKHMEQIQLLAPNAKIILVNGEIFSWYGYRTTKALSYFATLQQML